MAKNIGIRLDVALVLALSFFLSNNVEGRRHRGLTTAGNCTSSETFTVTKFGAKGHGKPIYAETGESLNGLAFIQAWEKACHSKGATAKVVIPKGNFVVAQVVFEGPCESHVTVELNGEVTPDPDVGQFPNNELFVFQNVDGVTFTGHGKGSINACNNQPRQSLGDDRNRLIDFFNLMPSIKFVNVTNSLVEGITSLNPRSFHVLVAQCQNVTIRNCNFQTSSLVPNSNSNGIYISASTQVALSNSIISTGDDCVTVAPGSLGVSITGLTCSNGFGIGLGSQGYTSDLDIKGVSVKNCTFKGTTYGARIYPRRGASPSEISNIVFEDLVLDGVQTPVYISQQFDLLLQLLQPKICDVHFRNIRGTATTNQILSFSCDPLCPCDGIEVADINVNVAGGASGGAAAAGGGGDVFGAAGGLLGAAENFLGLKADCLNANVLFNGQHDGLECCPLPLPPLLPLPVPLI